VRVRHVVRLQHRIPRIAADEDVDAAAIALVVGGELPAAARCGHSLGQIGEDAGPGDLGIEQFRRLPARNRESLRLPAAGAGSSTAGDRPRRPSRLPPEVRTICWYIGAGHDQLVHLLHAPACSVRILVASQSSSSDATAARPMMPKIARGTHDAPSEVIVYTSDSPITRVGSGFAGSVSHFASALRRPVDSLIAGGTMRAVARHPAT